MSDFLDSEAEESDVSILLKIGTYLHIFLLANKIL